MTEPPAEPGSPPRHSPRVLLLPVAALVLLGLYGVFIRHGPALADEFIYLAGARHLLEAGDLDARFYDTRAILSQGYPHQDNHSPGYVLFLAALIRVFGGGYWTAVGLNAIAFIAAPLLVRSLALHLGRAPSEAWASAVMVTFLPAFLPYVFWVMAEALLPVLFLVTLVCAARLGRTAVGGATTGLYLRPPLVRESALFGLPVIALLRGRRAIGAAMVVVLGLGILVYAPLSAHRSEGASNFWSPTYGTAFGFEVVSAGLLKLQVFAILNRFKISRQRRQQGIADYVERYIDTKALTRIVPLNGWLFGLRHYPTEMITSVPDEGGDLRRLERAVWFDYLVLPGDTPLAAEMEGRIRYIRLNGQDPDPPYGSIGD
jgi:hypothetical protein